MMQSPHKEANRAIRHVALMRGINLGGKNRLSMKDLAALFTAAGCNEVQTYIQSGNVVFSAPPQAAARLATELTGEIKRQFKLSAPIVLRTAEEMAEILQKNPLLKAGAAEETMHAVFLAALPSPGSVASLDPQRSPGDSFLVRGREIYLHLPNGVAASKLTNAYFDAKLKTIGTQRNWRTVVKLSAMLQAAVLKDSSS